MQIPKQIRMACLGDWSLVARRFAMAKSSWMLRVARSRKKTKCVATVSRTCTQVIFNVKDKGDVSIN